MPRDPTDEPPERILREGRLPAFVQERLLEHPLRQAIVDLLEERPGMNKNQICTELDMDGRVVNHHLEKLEEGQLVETRPSPQGRETLCFRLEDIQLWDDESTRILYGRSKSRRVAIYLTENPGATTREIGKAVNLSPVTVRYHLATLKQYELVHRYSAGQTFVYGPDEVLERWVEEVGAGFERPWEV